MLIKNWQELGLEQESYLRIEMPIKLESGQFQYKITEMSLEEVNIYYEEIYKLFNMDTFRKIANHEKIEID